jgi:hypothetical protein
MCLYFEVRKYSSSVLAPLGAWLVRTLSPTLITSASSDLNLTLNVVILPYQLVLIFVWIKRRSMEGK